MSAIVGAPGFMKSAACSIVEKALNAMDYSYHQQRCASLEMSEADAEAIEEEDAKEGKPSTARIHRTMFADITQAALRDKLKRHNAPLVAVHDEMKQLFEMLAPPKSMPNGLRQFLLKLASGSTCIFDRASAQGAAEGRGQVVIEDPRVSVTGYLQPSVLQHFADREAAMPAHNADGMVARFLYAAAFARSFTCKDNVKATEVAAGDVTLSGLFACLPVLIGSLDNISVSEEAQPTAFAIVDKAKATAAQARMSSI